MRDARAARCAEVEHLGAGGHVNGLHAAQDGRGELRTERVPHAVLQLGAVGALRARARGGGVLGRAQLYIQNRSKRTSTLISFSPYTCFPGFRLSVHSASSRPRAMKTPGCRWGSITTFAPPFMLQGQEKTFRRASQQASDTNQRTPWVRPLVLRGRHRESHHEHRHENPLVHGEPPVLRDNVTVVNEPSRQDKEGSNLDRAKLMHTHRHRSHPGRRHHLGPQTRRHLHHREDAQNGEFFSATAYKRHNARPPPRNPDILQRNNSASNSSLARFGVGFFAEELSAIRSSQEVVVESRRT